LYTTHTQRTTVAIIQQVRSAGYTHLTTSCSGAFSLSSFACICPILSASSGEKEKESKKILFLFRKKYSKKMQKKKEIMLLLVTIYSGTHKNIASGPMAHWISSLVQKDSNTKKESISCTEP
jgi:hypothetical protein